MDVGGVSFVDVKRRHYNDRAAAHAINTTYRRWLSVEVKPNSCSVQLNEMFCRESA